MRELTTEEVTQVSGGKIDWETGGLTIIAISMGSGVTAGFGVPIGLAMIYVGMRMRMRTE